MKRFLALSLCLCLLLALAACGASASSAPASASAPPASAPASEAASDITPLEELEDDYTYSDTILEALQPLFTSYQGDEPALPDFLDETQQAQYFAAFILTCEMNSFGTGFGSDGTGGTTEDGNYMRCNGSITTWEQLEAVVDAVFTRECFDALNYTDSEYPYFKEVDGALYYNTGGRGGNMEYVGPDTFEPQSQDDNAITFNLVGHYEDFDTQEPYTEDFPIAMENTHGGWRFSQFAISF